MLFLMSFVIAALAAMFCDKAMRKAPQAFYIGATVLALVFSIVDFKNANPFVKNYIAAMFTKGTFATALFVIVMFTGAVRNGSYLMKKLMPIRAQLSIIASILILVHGFNYGKIYITRLIKAPDSLPAVQIVFVIFSLIMIAIMIPLAVISFKKIRSKMSPKRWKKIQRAAYVFYGLIYLHILLIDLPTAQKGNKDKIINIIVYSIVFISYAVMRVSKAVLKKHKEAGRTVSISFGSAGFALMAAVCALVFIPYAHTLKDVSEPVANTNAAHTSTESSVAETADNNTSESENEEIDESISEDNDEASENENKDTEVGSKSSSSSNSSNKNTDKDKNTSSNKNKSESNSSDTSSKKNTSDASSKNTQSKSVSESKTESKSNSNSSGSNNTSSKSNTGTDSKSNTSSKTNANTSSKSNTSSKTNANTSSKSNTSSKTNANTSSKSNTSSKTNTNNNTSSKANNGNAANTNSNPSTPANTSSTANTNQNTNNSSTANTSSREEVVSVKEPEPEPEPASIAPEEPEPEPVVQTKYRDGTYEAKAFNYEYDLVVKVTIENDVITKIEAEAFEDDMWYFERARDKIVPQILEKQSTEDIDALSESTISSDAIKKAINEALKQAEN